MYSTVATYLIENDKGLFKVDVWESGIYTAVAQQLLVDEYRTCRFDGSNKQGVANSAVNQLIEKYKL